MRCNSEFTESWSSSSSSDRSALLSRLMLDQQGHVRENVLLPHITEVHAVAGHGSMLRYDD